MFPGINYYFFNSQRVLVGARFDSFKVELGWPAHENNPNCFPCLFLQFSEPDGRTSKLLQIFSKQAPMMDALITRFHRGRSRNDYDNIDEVDLGAEPSDIDAGLSVT